MSISTAQPIIGLAIGCGMRHRQGSRPDNLPVTARILTADLIDFVRLFYNTPDELGRFDSVPASEVPPPYHELLCHRHHMTVTVERFNRGPVDVRVLDRRTAGDIYARKFSDPDAPMAASSCSASSA